MFDKDTDESFQGAEHRAMQHHRQVLFAVFADVGRSQSSRHVEIHLQGAALPVAPDCISQHELELRSVKRAFPGVMSVVEPGDFERLEQRGFRLVPDLVFADANLRAIGKLDSHVLETEIAVNAEDQLADSDRLPGDLFGCAEDVRVILRECAHPHHAVQRSGRLVTMALAEFCEAHRQVAVTRDALFEYLYVAGTVHRLDGEVPAVDRLGREHVLAECLEVARFLPQCRAHEFGRVDLAVTRVVLLLPHVADEVLVQSPPLWVPEYCARRLFLEVEQVHDTAESAVVALLCFLEHVQVLAQLLVVGPGGAVDPLQHFVRRIAAPIRARHMRQLE